MPGIGELQAGASRIKVSSDGTMPVQTYAKISLNYSFIIFAFIFFCRCDSPIEKYASRNEDEKEIISVLIRYQNAKNRFDLKRLLSLLHENGEFSFQCGLMVSKAKLAKMLPEFWTGIKSGDASVFPMVHECINGDYYKSGRLNNPQIEINGNKAEATVLFAKGLSRVLQYFSLLRENNRWLITRAEWGQS